MGAGTKNTNRYRMLRLRFEDGIFNEQQTTLVSIGPHGGEISMWQKKSEVSAQIVPSWGPEKMPPKKTSAFWVKTHR